MQTELTANDRLVEGIRLRVYARLQAIGSGRPLSVRGLCDAWAEHRPNDEPPLMNYHVQTLLRSDSPKLREVAQLAAMLGTPLYLLVCPDTMTDEMGRTPIQCIYDLERYPPPPPVVSRFPRAA